MKQVARTSIVRNKDGKFVGRVFLEDCRIISSEPLIKWMDAKQFTRDMKTKLNVEGTIHVSVSILPTVCCSAVSDTTSS